MHITLLYINPNIITTNYNKCIYQNLLCYYLLILRICRIEKITDPLRDLYISRLYLNQSACWLSKFWITFSVSKQNGCSQMLFSISCCTYGFIFSSEDYVEGFMALQEFASKSKTTECTQFCKTFARANSIHRCMDCLFILLLFSAALHVLLSRHKL